MKEEDLKIGKQYKYNNNANNFCKLTGKHLHGIFPSTVYIYDDELSTDGTFFNWSLDQILPVSKKEQKFIDNILKKNNIKTKSKLKKI